MVEKYMRFGPRQVIAMKIDQKCFEVMKFILRLLKLLFVTKKIFFFIRVSRLLVRFFFSL